MIKEICKDIIILSMKASDATADDCGLAEDLLDTLKANEERCVGMAANMIGVPKKIIAVNDNGNYLLMLNPEIIKSDAAYSTEEGCLSLEGVRPVKRYRSIKIRWQTVEMKPMIKTFKGFTAQIIQHEIDHLAGILI